MYKFYDLCGSIFEAGLGLLEVDIDALLTASDGKPVLCKGVGECRSLAEYDDKVDAMIAAAETPRAWFSEHAPHWSPQPLPLTFAECRGIYAGEMLPGCMTGLYSLSLRRMRYKYRVHPSLQTYAEGLMCFAPADHQNVFRRYVPARPLPGLDGVIWRPPVQRAVGL